LDLRCNIELYLSLCFTVGLLQTIKTGGRLRN